MLSILSVIAGLVILGFAGDALVRGASDVALRLRISPTVVGLTVVAFGTSAPELIVSVEAALVGAPDLAIGNVVGSNIANALIVLGLPAVIFPIFITEPGIRRSTSFMVGVSLVLIAISSDGELSRIEGLVLVAGLLVYLAYSVAEGRRSQNVEPPAYDDTSEPPPFHKSSVAIGLGAIGLGLGGKLATDGAIGIAELAGLSQSTVGLTILALGTSLPELAASIAAALRKQTAVLIGNVIGSNIFNILGVAGITALIAPMQIAPSLPEVDMWLMLASSALILPIAFTRRRIERWEGTVMTALYTGYMIFVIQRGFGG